MLRDGGSWKGLTDDGLVLLDGAEVPTNHVQIIELPRTHSPKFNYYGLCFWWDIILSFHFSYSEVNFKNLKVNIDRLNYSVLASYYYFGKLHKNKRAPKKEQWLGVPDDGLDFLLRFTNSCTMQAKCHTTDVFSYNPGTESSH